VTKNFTLFARRRLHVSHRIAWRVINNPASGLMVKPSRLGGRWNAKKMFAPAVSRVRDSTYPNLKIYILNGRKQVMYYKKIKTFLF